MSPFADVFVMPLLNTVIGFAAGRLISSTCVLAIHSTIGALNAAQRSPSCKTLYSPSLALPPSSSHTGILFILATKQALSSHESEEEIGPDSLNVGWEKMVLIMFVMTLHSLTEGVGEYFVWYSVVLRVCSCVLVCSL